MKTNEILYLSGADVAASGVTMARIIEILKTAFFEKGEGRVQMPPKPGVYPDVPDSFIHAMPAYIPALKSAGIKWVGGFPDNPKKGLPYISGLLIYNDVTTGLPLAVMDCVWITAMRTGAATALSALYLAGGDSSTVGVLGCGVQGRTNLEAINVLFPIRRVMAYNVHSETAEIYADEVSERFDIEAVVVDDPRKAVSGCDIVITAGPIMKKPHATIQPGWLKPGAFASLVDFDSYWHTDAIREVDKFCTDDTAQYLHYQNDVGYFRGCPEPYADLGELVTGKKEGRTSESEITMTANLGLAIEDMAVAAEVYKAAIERGLGMRLPL